MKLSPDPSVENLQQSLALYRRLVSVLRTPKSETEVIRAVVDAIFEQFPKYRAAFSRLEDDGTAHIVYSRQPQGAVSLSGRKFSFAKVPGLMGMLRSGKPIVSPDVRAVEGLAPVRQELVELGGTISRVDVPFRESEENLFVLSLGSSSPVDWHPTTVELLKEVGDLVCLMLREARMQQELEKSETLFRQFAENVRVVFWMTDITKMEMVYVSPSYELVWGRSMQSLYDEPLSFIEAIHPEDRERVKHAIMRQAEEPYEQQYRLVRPSGEVRWVRDRGFQVRDESGRVHRIAGIAEDITQLKEAQDRLEASQAQVVSTTKFAALGEMASGIAHEINNPLAVIHGLSVQLQELFQRQGSQSPMVLESLASMEKMANRIAVIVKGLRTFSRQTPGDPMAPADISVVVQETMAMCAPKLRDAGVAVKLELPDGRLQIRCRSSEISQVVLNLVNNAYDAVVHAPEKWVRVSVLGVASDSNVMLQVEDSGAGILPELRDRIFQPFFTTKEVGRGTGLGLSISKGIVEAHGGTLSLDPSAKCTRFVVRLPSE